MKTIKSKKPKDRKVLDNVWICNKCKKAVNTLYFQDKKLVCEECRKQELHGNK